MQRFKEAIETGNIPAALELLADDVVFRSPAVHQPYPGKPAASVILTAVNEVFENFRYTREWHDETSSVLVFEANVGDKQLEGADFIRLNGDGLIDDFRVMIRPLKGLESVVEAMGREIPKAMQKLGVTADQLRSGR